MFNGRALRKCDHFELIKISKTNPEQCLKCVELGDEWNHLRTCLICGDVGCCGSSKNKHAEKHYKETGHSMFHITESGTNIAYCYVDDNYFKF